VLKQHQLATDESEKFELKEQLQPKNSNTVWKKEI
jgi:hypothetical protein